jgi:phosphatidylserine/phosphatidylglycerophosphate/cardiolipin synthase-like enzyme
MEASPDMPQCISGRTRLTIDILVSHREAVVTGRFNFSKAAQEQNAENVQIIRDKALAAQYTQNWQAHAQHRQP